MDASVLRIFPRKVILLRSNGQQETMFMYQEDAKAEMSELKDVTWHDVVQRQTEIRFLVNPTSFASRIATLAELIDALDALPATKEGEAIGLRIGNMDRNSIGFALGFQPGDLITHIADIPTTSTEDRMKAYNKVIQLKMGSSCVVKGKRKGRPLMHTYTLFNLADEGATQKAPSTQMFGPSGQQGFQQMPMPNQAHAGGFAQPAQAPQQDLTQVMQQRDREAMNMYGAKQSAMPFEIDQGALA